MVLVFGQLNQLLADWDFVFVVDYLADFGDGNCVLGLDQVGRVDLLALHEGWLVVGLRREGRAMVLGGHEGNWDVGLRVM
jgi:hypothetical protein